MKRPLVIAALLGLAVAAAGAQAYLRRPPSVAAPAPAEPRLVAATFSAAWCGSCAILKPKLAEAMTAFSSAPVAFVEYDFTLGASEALRARADADGLAALYDAAQGATGYTLLVDADTGALIDTLTMNHSAAAMRAAIDNALAVASADLPVTE